MKGPPGDPPGGAAKPGPARPVGRPPHRRGRGLVPANPGGHGRSQCNRPAGLSQFLLSEEVTRMAYEYDVFLSYRTQFPFGKWVHEHLLPFFEPYLENTLNRPVRVFVDREGISTGDAWPQQLKNALAHSRCLVAVWCPSYFGSSWCLAELTVMMYREQQLGYRTISNPSGLVIPIIVHDGEHFPDYARSIQCSDFSRFTRVGYGFTTTERYIEFQDKLVEWVEDVARCINKAPPWRREWLGKEWIDDPITSISPPSVPEFFPSLE